MNRSTPHRDAGDADEGPDLYRVLQVDPDADPDVVQAAYRVLARKRHPDLVGDEQAMKALNAAWEILGDAERRARYDGDRGAAALARKTAPASPKPYLRDHAGPPPGNPSGPIVGFGRYEGWSLGEIARVDKEFLEWLRAVPAGRGLKGEIDTVLRQMSAGRGARSPFGGHQSTGKDSFKT
jgi:curved DNA-binding protein CbpA